MQCSKGKAGKASSRLIDKWVFPAAANKVEIIKKTLIFASKLRPASFPMAGFLLSVSFIELKRLPPPSLPESRATSVREYPRPEGATEKIIICCLVSMSVIGY